MNVEKRLQRLIDEIKALKGAYSTAGSSLRTYTTTNTFTVGGSGSMHSVRFKFTPTYGKGKTNVMDFSVIGVRSYFGSGRQVNVPFRIEPQSGDGDVFIATSAYFVNGDTVRVIAVGVSPGAITMV